MIYLGPIEYCVGGVGRVAGAEAARAVCKALLNRPSERICS